MLLEQAMTDQSFPARYRIRRQADFDRVYQSGVYAADATLVVTACANGLPHARLGLSVSRKVGNAVVRNRWKRRLREAFRLCREELPQGIDYVLRPRRGAELDFAAIRTSLPQLARRVAARIERSRQQVEGRARRAVGQNSDGEQDSVKQQDGVKQRHTAGEQQRE